MTRIAKTAIYQTCALVLTVVVKVVFRARFYGRENIPPHGALVIARHASYWDVPLTVAAFHWRRCLTFVARRSLQAEHPVLRPFIATYAIPVDRDQFRMSDFRSVLEAIRAGRWVAIFPEGTIRRTDKVYPGVIRFSEISGREFLPVRLRVRRGAYPPRYPFGFPALDVIIGRPFTLRDLEFDLAGDETREARYRALSRLMMARVDRSEA